MAAESAPNQLYYSQAAIDRFADNEFAIRQGILDRTAAAAAPRLERTITNLQGSPVSKQIITSPMFGAWQDRLIQARALIDTSDEANDEIKRRAFYIGNYQAAALHATRQKAKTSLWSHNGHIMIPEVGRVVLGGQADGFMHVYIDDGLTFDADAGEVHIAADQLAEPSEHWQPLRHIGPPDFRVALNDIDPNRDIFRYPVAERLSDKEHNRWHSVFCDAWDFLKTHDPYTAQLIRHTLTTIVPAPPEPLTHGKSMAAGAAFGVIGINEHSDPERLATHLIYGTRKHLAIALKNDRPDMFPAEGDPRTTTPVYPPSQEGHRVVMHLQEDAFLNIGLARFFAHALTAAQPELLEYAQLSFARWFVESQQNMDGLRAAHAANHSEELLTALEQELAALAPQYEHIPDSLKQLVATNVLDRATSWRLHNITPDARAVRYLREAWLREEPCPAIVVSGTLSQSIEAYTHLGQRTRYVLKESGIKGHREGDPPHIGAPTAGDIAFASGNIREARNYFTAAIRMQPQDPESWAGLALTFEHEASIAAQTLRRYPELAAAVYAAIGNPDIAPEAVAAWLADCTVTTAIDRNGRL